MQDRLTEVKLRVCVTPQEQRERVQELAALSSSFVALTTSTAERIGRAYHLVKMASGAETGATSALTEAMHRIRPDGSLVVVVGGSAGGIKVLDRRDHAFFKISEDQHRSEGRRGGEGCWGPAVCRWGDEA